MAQAAVDPAAVEKEAFDAAKELGTVEAWQAFLGTYATGFRADLARAYIAKLGTDKAATTPPAAGATPPVQTAIPPVQTTIPPIQNTAPPVQALITPPADLKLGLLDLGPGIAPWQNGTLDLDDGNRPAYVAQVAGSGMELYAFCQPPETKKGAYSLALRLRENPRGVYPFFDERLQQGIDGSPAAGPDFKQIALRFEDGSVFGVTGRVFGMTGELEITGNGKPFSPTGKIVEAMMGGRTMTVLADPFSGTFQLTNSRPALCSVLTACGVKISACKGISAPKISSKQTKPLTQTKTFVPSGQTATKGVSQQNQFVPGGPQGGATLVIQQTATGSCPDPKTQIRNAAGQCVCNAANTLVSGKCVKACVGATRDLNGNCQCPAGQTYHPNGYCIDGTNEAALQKTVKAGEGQTCPDGRLRDVSGACLNLCSGERVWNGQKCIGGAEAKNYYCRDLGLPEKGAEEGFCKAAPGSGLTVKLVPQVGTGKTKGTGGTTGFVLPQGGGDAVPVLQLFQGLIGGTQPQGGGTTQQKQVVTCKGGQVPQQDGSCACPSGQQFDGSKCTTKFTFTGNAKITPDPNANPFGAFTATKQVACAGGAQMGADGKCACPSGQTFDGKTCVVDKVVRTQDATGGGVTTQKVVCTGGQLPQANGTCACPGGLALVNGKCPGTSGGTFTQTKTTVICTGGQIPQNGGCACPSGQQFTGGKCVAAGGPQGIIPGAPSGLNLMLSDRRMKTDVSKVATLANGIRVYAFRYLSDDTMRVGVMAQDLLVDARTRFAVHEVGGLYAVDYGALGLRMATLAEWRERGRAAVVIQR